MTYDTTSTAAKHWFYPRYPDGSLHERQITHSVLRQLNENRVFYDLGCNVGWYTVLASAIGAEVHAFDMDPTLLDALRDSLQLNDLSATVNQRAVSNETADTITFAGAGASLGGYVPTLSERRETDAVADVTAETVRLDDYVSDGKPAPDILKIDIEGAEWHALDGAHDILTGDTAPVIYLDVHPVLLKDQGASAEAVFDILQSHGYEWRAVPDKYSDDLILEKQSSDKIGEKDHPTAVICQKESDFSRL